MTHDDGPTTAGGKAEAASACAFWKPRVSLQGSERVFLSSATTRPPPPPMIKTPLTTTQRLISGCVEPSKPEPMFFSARGRKHLRLASANDATETTNNEHEPDRRGQLLSVGAPLGGLAWRQRRTEAKSWWKESDAELIAGAQSCVYLEKS